MLIKLHTAGLLSKAYDIFCKSRPVQCSACDLAQLQSSFQLFFMFFYKGSTIILEHNVRNFFHDRIKRTGQVVINSFYLLSICTLVIVFTTVLKNTVSRSNCILMVLILVLCTYIISIKKKLPYTMDNSYIGPLLYYIS